MSLIKLLVACGSTIFHTGIRNICTEKEDFKVVKEASSINKAILYAKKSPPDLFLICFQHYLESGNLRYISEIKKKVPNTKIVLFNSRATLEQELELVKQGGFGILEHTCSNFFLVAALKKIHAGELWFSRKLMLSLLNPHLDALAGTNSKMRKTPLTKRELDVLKALAGGHTNSEIASQLFLAEATIKTHVNNIYKKLAVNDRLQASFYALKNNLVSR